MALDADWALWSAGTAHGTLRGASVVLYALLLVAWLVVAARTAHGAATGRLLGPMAPAARPVPGGASSAGTGPAGG
ncbi:MAG: hypothetical protein ACLPKE_21860 [Streptosporangiaceae bacterium]